MDEWQCYYCDFTSTDFSEVINSSVGYHPDNLLKVKVKKNLNGNSYSINSKNFQVVPSEVFASNKFITCIQGSEDHRIRISSCFDDDLDIFLSPDEKVLRLYIVFTNRNENYYKLYYYGVNEIRKCFVTVFIHQDMLLNFSVIQCS